MESIRLTKSATLIFIPISYLAVMIAHSFQSQSAGAFARMHLLAALVTLTTTTLLLLLLLFQKTSKRKSISVTVNLLIISFIGAIRGATMYFLAIKLGITSDVSLSYRLFNSTITTVIWLSFISYIGNSRRTYHEKYRLFFTQSLLTQTIRITGVELNRELLQVENSLKSISIFPPDAPITNSQFEEVAKAVKSQLDEFIRPLSQRLWLPTVQDYPRVKPLRLLIDAITNLKYPLLPLIAVISTLNLANFSALIALDEALYRVAIFIIVMSTIYFVFQKLPVVSGSSYSFIQLAHLTALGVLPVLIGDWLSKEVYFDTRLPISLIVYLATPVLAISFSVIGLIQSDRTRLIESMAVGESSSEEYQRSQVASYLHNSLQSELLALSRKLEEAAKSNDKNFHRESLEQLSATLNRSLSQDFKGFYESPRQRLTQLISSWSGIITIKIDDLETFLSNATKSIIAIQILEELASNAAKHSNTTELMVQVEYDSGCLHLLVTANDDYEPITKAGYGTDFLTAVTKSWVRSGNSNNQTEMRIVL